LLISPEKANKRLYFFSFSLLVQAGVKRTDILQVYDSIVRSVLEYDAEVWNGGLTKVMEDRLEHVQKRAIRIIFLDCDLSEACET